MSDIAVAFAVIPFLITLTLVLEGMRIGCTRLRGRVRSGSTTSGHAPAQTRS